MPLESVLYLAFVIGALILFAAALAYGDWATRHAMGEVAAPKASSTTFRKNSAAQAALSEPAQKAA